MTSKTAKKPEELKKQTTQSKGKLKLKYFRRHSPH